MRRSSSRRCRKRAPFTVGLVAAFGVGYGTFSRILILACSYISINSLDTKAITTSIVVVQQFLFLSGFLPMICMNQVSHTLFLLFAYVHIAFESFRSSPNDMIPWRKGENNRAERKMLCCSCIFHKTPCSQRSRPLRTKYRTHQSLYAIHCFVWWSQEYHWLGGALYCLHALFYTRL